jgi:ElaB/YqjD/DUF883 family membrane-anchored ribosome-binding protein
MDAANDRTAEGVATAADRISDELQRARDKIARSAQTAGADVAAELERLQKDIADIRRTIAGFAKASGADAHDAASRIGGVASEAVDDFVAHAKQDTQSVIADLEAYARKNPYQVLAGALGLGVILGLFFRRR